jgi:colanic acid/amylovoran biosynthesis glycosyltransferase
MKIAFFVHRFPALSEVFIANTAAGLIDAGHDVDIYALDGRSDSSQPRHDVVLRYRLEKRARSFSLEDSPRKQILMAPVAGMKVASRHGLKVSSVLDGSRYGIERRGLKALHEASMFRRGGRYDILHCHFGTLAEPVLQHRDAGLLSGKVVVHFRGNDISQHVRAQGAHVYDRVFREADAFVANCQFFRDRAMDLGAPGERITVVPSPVDLASFKFRPPSWEPGSPLKLLAVGRLVEKKGFRHAIEAVARLSGIGLDPHLTLAGSGPLAEDLRSQAALLGIGERVTFAGAVTHGAVARLLEQSHIFLAPSLTASDGDRDASINTLKEAMAAGLPFVASDHGGIPELVDGADAGVLTPEGRADVLAEGVQSLLERRAEWPEMGRRGRDRIESGYSIKSVTAQLLNVYQATLDDGRSNGPAREMV